MQSGHISNVADANSPLIPDHTLLRPIGRGAYGEVWLARNVMGALRAVKVIWRRQFESDRPYDREFAGIQRYEPVSRSSGGLVHVLHVGRNDPEEYFFYVMELADDAKERSDGVMEKWGDGQTINRQPSNPPSLQHSSAYSPRTRVPTFSAGAGCPRLSACEWPWTSLAAWRSSTGWDWSTAT